MSTFVCISVKKPRVKSTKQFLIRDMKKFKLKDYLMTLGNNLNAANLDSTDSVHDAFDKFEEVFKNTVNKFAPLKKASRREKKLSKKPWLSRELLNLIKQKNKLFKQLHKKFDKDIFENYKKQRNALNRKIMSAKEAYYKDLIDDNTSNFSTLWKIIGELANLKKTKNTFPSEIVTDNDVIDDPQKIYKAFNVHFATIGEKIGKNIKSHESTPPLLPNSPNSFFFSSATPEEIYSLIGNIKIKKAVRENDIDNKLLKLSNTIISPFLSSIFNSCIQQEEFPYSLKIAEVAPVFKKGDSNLLTNYRPISILSQISKIFEKLIYNRINNYLEKYHLISDEQFGFRQNSSTSHAISNIYEKLI